MKNNKPVTFCVLLILFLSVCKCNTLSQTSNDYRSKISGDWSDPASWERFNGTAWVTAINPPDNTCGVITIRNGNNITFNQDKIIDQLVIEAGSLLTVNSSITLYTSDGDGDEITVYGTLLYQGAVAGSLPGTGVLKNGGTFIHNTVYGTVSNIVNFFSVKENGSNWIYRGSETTNTPVSLAGKSFGNLAFESTSGIYAVTFGGTTPLTVNGDFLVGSGVTMTVTNNAANIFKGNYTISGSLVLSSGVQNFSFAGNGEKIISGNGTLYFEIIGINAGSVVKLNNNINVSNSLIVNGTLDCTDRTLGGSGTITLSSGAAYKTSHSGGVNGNILLSGTKSISPSTNFEFNGTAAQVTGSLLSSCNNLKINNAAGVTLSGPVNIDNVFELNTGCLILGNNNLVIGSAASITGGSQSSFVSTNGTGFLKKMNVEVDSDFRFPIGNITYSPVIIKYTGTQDNFGARVKNSLDHIPNGTAYVNKQWTLSEDVSGGTTAQIKFLWNSGDNNPSFNPANDIYIGRFNGSVYAQSPALLAGTGPYTAVSEGFTSFSDFAVGNQNVLPVNIINLNFKVANSDVLLKWSTTYELNNTGFYIERRNINDSLWCRLDFIKGKSNGYIGTDYSYTDKNLYPGEYYYRIIQTDNNGNHSIYYYNQLCVIEIPSGLYLCQNYPNPFNSKTLISFSLNSVYETNVGIFAINGKLLYSYPASLLKAGYHTIIIDGSGLASGSYIVRLTASNGIKTIRLSKMITLIK
ncbi:MAG: T9SS type A sorting domain-containing protein [Ignavibacteria bacterium]|nr:T9SS type A sorting domain-containing protein [Ignavibacteria bacterium]